MPPTLSVLYARISNNRKNVGLSVSAQLRTLRDYASRNGLSVACEYVDEADSGSYSVRDRHDRQKRPQLAGPHTVGIRIEAIMLTESPIPEWQMSQRGRRTK